MDYLIHATTCKHIHLTKISSSTQPMSNTEDCTENDYATTSTSAEDTCHLSSALEHYDVSNDVGSICRSDSTGTEGTTSTNTCDHLPNIAETPMETQDVSSLQYLSHQIRNQENLDDLLTMQETAISTCKQMELVLRECTNIEAIEAGRKHLNAAFTVVTSLDCKSITNLPVKKRPAPNAHQQRKSAKLNHNLAKPN